MSILIFSESYDNSTNCVVEYLNQFNVPYVRVNTNLNYDNVYAVNIQNGGIGLKFNLRGQFYSIDDFDLIWARRGFFEFHHLNLKNKFKYPEIDTVFQNHIKTEIRYLTDFLAYVVENGKSFCIGNPSNYEINKLVVLQKATRHGLNIPETCIVKNTTTLKDVFNENAKLISKPISNCLKYFLPENEHSPSKLIFQENATLSVNKLNDEKFYYSLFQDKINIKLELRIFFILEKYFCCAFINNSEDFEKRRIMPYKLPDGILNKLKRLMADLKLNTGSIDMLIDEKSNYYFLEVNPCGQIEWLAEQCFPNLHLEIAKIIRTKYEATRNKVL